MFFSDKAYRVVAVGIGSDVDNSSLSSIASLPSDENVFTVADFSGLSDVVDEVGYDICQVKISFPKKHSSVIFLGGLLERGPVHVPKWRLHGAADLLRPIQRQAVLRQRPSVKLERF